MSPSRRAGAPSRAGGRSGDGPVDAANEADEAEEAEEADGAADHAADAAADGGGGPPPRRRVDRLAAAAAEQGRRCFWCRRPFTALVPPTTDHVVPRVKGGPSWRENEVAACRRCNGQRGHLGPVDWLEECLRRGWPAEADELAATLARLDAAIEQRGGQRRARPYLDGQRRRLRHGVG